jgi:tryptophanyl-tRNA synthetase
MSKSVILTGIRANNDLHIGNYFGALLPMVDMATQRAGEYQVNLFVPDLHSFTTPIDHSKLYEQIMHNLKLFVAAGLPLDNPDIHIYRQSYVPAHSELAWILDCFTGFGEMSRMTQFKDKSGKLEEDRISVGLFNYPVLMAADMLLYGAAYVPVGEDQTQHLEFTRDIGMRMNARFGQLFTVPKPVKEQHEFFGKDQGLRIKDLIDPTKKMSKSDESTKGIIFLGDDPEAAAKKIMGATTDSVGSVHLDRDKQPGIVNLIQILALLRSQALVDVAKDYEGKTSYGELKNEVADRIKTFLTEFQSRLVNVDEGAIVAKLESSEAAMRETSNKTLEKAQRAVGLRPQIAATQDESIMEYSVELDKMGIGHEIKDHPLLKTPAETQAYLGLEMSDGLSTMIMRTGDKYIAVLRRDDCRLDFAKIKALVGDNVRMATPEEFVDLTSLPVGAARVYNPGLDTYLDNKLFEKEYLTGGTGSFTCSFRYKTEDLKKLPNVKIVDVLE